MRQVTDFGEALKALRKAKGLSQEELASRSGISQSEISSIESGGRKDPALTTVAKLATALDTSLDDFVESLTEQGARRPGIGLEDLVKHLLIDLPFLGSVPCGKPLVVSEVRGEYVSVPFAELRGSRAVDCFVLRASGDSLAGDGIQDGDYLIVDRNAPIIAGKLYVVTILGTDTFACHVYHERDKLKLLSSNGQTIAVLEADKVENRGRIISSGHWRGQ